MSEQTRWEFIAFVRGSEQRSQIALYNLRRICANYIKEPYDIEVVDLAKEPERAREAEIIALPTVIRRRPLPEARIVGDLSDTGSVLRAINIQPEANEEWSANISEQVKMLHYSIIRLSESFLSMFADGTGRTEQEEKIYGNILRSAKRHLDFEDNLNSIRKNRHSGPAQSDVEAFQRGLADFERRLEAGEAQRSEVVEFIRDWFVKRFRT
jgi:circadian clock protein KaiB